MKRVLHIMGGLKRGGLESFAMNIYRAINRQEFQFDFLLTHVFGGDYEEEAKALGANIYYVAPRNSGYRAYTKALDEFFSQHNEYVAVHFHISSLSSIEPLVYAQKYRIPVRILHSHSSSIQKSIRFNWAHKILHYVNKMRIHYLATHYLACSDKALDWMYKYSGVRSKAIIVNNGIDCSQYKYNEDIRADVRREFNIKTEDIVIGHVGRFIPLKNQSFLIDILEALCERLQNIKLMLIGEGDTFEDIKLKAENKNLSNNILFTGVRSDVNRLLQAIDVFVMPSLFEGLPVSLVEAQASGLPIVASDTISHDSDITGTILFKSIKDTPVDWGENILQWKDKVGRPNNIAKLKDAGFDSIATVELLKTIYLNIV